MLPVTRTFLPPQDEYNLILNELWKSKWLTNRGNLVKTLEDKIKGKLNYNEYVLLMCNGTLPIQIALKLFAQKKKVITTPFSYVATTSSIIWEGLEPVFVDIDEKYFTIDENKIEDYITEDTALILATHVYGNPCNVEALEFISKKYNVPLLYDGAHGFGVTFNDKSIFEYGDISTCSFHATKIFHTAEGGAVFCNKEETYNNIFNFHNFGHKGYEDFHGVGINGKMSELNAAMGLAVLPYLDEIIAGRKKIVDCYNECIDHNRYQTIQIRLGTKWNYSYFPILCKNEEHLLLVEQKLKENNILPRRYFYPSLNTLPYIKKVKMPVAEHISGRVLCLPLFYEMTQNDVEAVINTINKI